MRSRSTAGYALDGDALVCRLEVENRSALVVENVTFPCLTDVQALPSGDQLDLFTYAYASAQRGHLRPSFTNVPGYFGVDRPTLLPSPYASTVPGAPFVLLEGAGGGLYVGIDAPQPELLTWVAELEPGYSGSMGAWVPPGATIGPKDVRVEVSTVHLPFVMPGEHRPAAGEGAVLCRGLAGRGGHLPGPPADVDGAPRPRRAGRPDHTPGSRSR